MPDPENKIGKVPTSPSSLCPNGMSNQQPDRMTMMERVSALKEIKQRVGTGVQKRGKAPTSDRQASPKADSDYSGGRTFQTEGRASSKTRGAKILVCTSNQKETSAAGVH